MRSSFTDFTIGTPSSFTVGSTMDSRSRVHALGADGAGRKVAQVNGRETQVRTSNRNRGEHRMRKTKRNSLLLTSAVAVLAAGIIAAAAQGGGGMGGGGMGGGGAMGGGGVGAGAGTSGGGAIGGSDGARAGPSGGGTLRPGASTGPSTGRQKGRDARAARSCFRRGAQRAWSRDGRAPRYPEPRARAKGPRVRRGAQRAQSRRTARAARHQRNRSIPGHSRFCARRCPRPGFAFVTAAHAHS